MIISLVLSLLAILIGFVMLYRYLSMSKGEMGYVLVTVTLLIVGAYRAGVALGEILP